MKTFLGLLILQLKRNGYKNGEEKNQTKRYKTDIPKLEKYKKMLTEKVR